ncbi:spinster family MFS transporter [Paraburkholderia unamae]|uniref:MFS family arabinose efflux permease n=1 Tax=Paraburkholderia unamae TaxID=219649 RepID=A0ABX5KK16_9BURK|nr:MFS transporter [Paraburkholderia unamae]PVX81174.1 putative MFS family arabinose efflux permease [Paraburkholderia unamae]RAR53359.1 putative MFS family arabinose efflux permease [Paraburkholderia unamae]CAG9248634.1 Predicted arabinose efflux permease, MFS family [Paraburkholderia unamae]
MKSEHSPLRRHSALLLFLVVSIINLIDRQMMGVVLEPVKKEFGVSDLAMGLLTGVAFALVYCVFALPLGRFADRTNRRNLISWSCAAWSVMTLLCGFATNYWTLALGRIGVAVGEAGSASASLTIVADLYPPRQRARALAVFTLGAPIGTLIGLSVGAWIAYYHGWRAAFVWMAVPGLVAALLVRLLAFEPARGGSEGAALNDSGRPEPLRTVLRDAWRSSAFVKIVISGALLGFSGYAFGIWSTAFLVRCHGLTLKDAGAIMGLAAGPGAIIGTLSSGWLTDRLAARDARWQLGVPIVGALLAFPLAVAFALYPSADPWKWGALVVPRVSVFMLGMSIFGMWWMAPSYAAITHIMRPDRRATTLSIYNFGVTAIGAGCGPLAVGALSDALTPAFGENALRWAMVGGAMGYLLAGLVLIGAVRPYARSIAAAVRGPALAARA